MLQIALLIAGVIWAVRKPRLKALTAAQFPELSEEVFAEWKAMELENINMLLWVSWGVFLISVFCMIAASFAIRLSNPVPSLSPAEVAELAVQGIQFTFITILLVMLILFDMRRRKLTLFKTRHGIEWPPSRSKAG